MAAFRARSCCWKAAVLTGFLAMVAGPLSAQTVTSVRVRQLADKTVEVLYNLANAPSPGATVTLAYQADGCPAPGITLPAPVLSGNVGAGVVSGTNLRIVWNAAATLAAGTNQSNFYVTVTAVLPTTPTPTPTITPTPTPTRTATPTPTPTPPGPTPPPGPTETWTLPGGVPLVMVRVPGGTFTMGSPSTERSRETNETQHQQTISSAYYMGRYEVTQGQWQAVMGTPVSTACGSYGVGNSYPVYCVTWNDIGGTGGFLEKLNAYLGLSGASRFRLPTEAEWEKAARGGTGTRFSFGDALDCDDVNCMACATADPSMVWCGNDAVRANPVGSKQSNPFGLYDAHGNVGEWVWDWYSTYPASPPADYAGPSTGTIRAIRGGSWLYGLKLARSADRDGSTPSYRFRDVGFRLCRSQ